MSLFPDDRPRRARDYLTRDVCAQRHAGEPQNSKTTDVAGDDGRPSHSSVRSLAQIDAPSAVKADNGLNRRLCRSGPHWKTKETAAIFRTSVQPAKSIAMHHGRPCSLRACCGRFRLSISAAGNAETRRQAEHTSRFLLTKSTDKWFGGFYWSVMPDGRGCEPDKHLYTGGFRDLRPCRLRQGKRRSGPTPRQALATFPPCRWVKATRGESFDRFWW